MGQSFFDQCKTIFSNLILENRLSVFTHESDHEMEVMDGGHCEKCELIGLVEMMQVGKGEILTSPTAALNLIFWCANPEVFRHQF